MADSPFPYITATLGVADLIVVGTGKSDPDGERIHVSISATIRGASPPSDLSVGAAGVADEVSGEPQVFVLVAKGSTFNLALPPTNPLLTPLRVRRFLAGGDLRDPPTDSDHVAQLALTADVVVHALITGTDLGERGRVDEIVWQSTQNAMSVGEVVEVPPGAEWDLRLGSTNGHWVADRTAQPGRWALAAPPASLGLSELKTFGWH